MKLFLAFLGGFGLTLVSFGGGIALAITYFSAEPVQQPGPSVDTAAMWPTEPVRVESDDGLERLPRRTAPEQGAAGTAITATDEAASPADDQSEDVAGDTLDMITTASLDGDEPAEPRDERRVTIMDGHVDWCLDHYRSYRVSDNSYQPYGARRREPCVSPFFGGDGESRNLADEYAADDHAAGEGGLIAGIGDSGIAAGSPAAGMTRDHIQACFDRYRSYRPEDNSYQPYGGGPRQQCM